MDKIKIVILDSYTTSDGDVAWSAMSKLGDLTLYPHTLPEQTYERCKGATAVLTNKVVIDEAMMDRLSELRYIGILATGYNVVDVTAAARRGIVVTNVPSYSSEAVAQLTIALLLHICTRVDRYSNAVNRGDWQNAPDFCFRFDNYFELSGLTMAVMGYGNIGRRVGAIARSLGMKVITSSRRDDCPEYVEHVSLDELFERADVLSLNCALTPETAGIINSETLSKMKPTAILLNTGRGGLVDEAALADALRSGRLYAAGLDVLGQEPPREGSPLIGLDNAFITPHIGWQTLQARQRLVEIASSNLAAWLAGNPVNVVS